MNRIKIAVAVIATAVMIGTSVFVVVADPVDRQPQDSGVEEVEDCDAEDFINREDDCGFVGPKVTPAKASPKPRATVRR